ncbi:uncharacterized protein [Halyomorpha halys]|uniref:uncharacterized protein n=1 Tax=Halyomorpha halys TaxID=286706 RepID=UPI0006D51035|nr:uncharacterized protein LOC106680660 [Halyomorpha halys]
MHFYTLAVLSICTLYICQCESTSNYRKSHGGIPARYYEHSAKNMLLKLLPQCDPEIVAKPPDYCKYIPNDEDMNEDTYSMGPPKEVYSKKLKYRVNDDDDNDDDENDDDSSPTDSSEIPYEVPISFRKRSETCKEENLDYEEEERNYKPQTKKLPRKFRNVNLPSESSYLSDKSLSKRPLNTGLRSLPPKMDILLDFIEKEAPMCSPDNIRLYRTYLETIKDGPLYSVKGTNIRDDPDDKRMRYLVPLCILDKSVLNFILHNLK